MILLVSTNALYTTSPRIAPGACVFAFNYMTLSVKPLFSSLFSGHILGIFDYNDDVVLLVALYGVEEDDACILLG